MLSPNQASELENPYPLAHKFFYRLLPALVLLLGVSVVLVGVVVQQASENIYLERATKIADNIATDVAGKSPVIWQKFLAGKKLTESDLLELEQTFAAEQKEYRLIGLKVYDLNRQVLFSHVAGQTGQYENGKALLKVIESQHASVVRHVDRDGSTVFELYVPYMKDNRLAAVFELYEPAQGEYQSLLHDMTVPVVSTLLALLGALVLLFVPVVNHAQKAITDRTSAIIGMRKRLERLLSRGAVDAMRQASTDNQPVSRQVEMTILYSDIRQFTSYCEGRKPENIVNVLNQMMDVQVKEIERQGGDVDKFVGDAVLARFEGENRFQSAVLAAIEIQKKLQASELPLQVGIGIFSGPVVAGLLGTGDRTDYTIIGDSVNVAARLCSSARASEIVCDVDTLEKANTKGFGEKTTVLAKGRAKPIAVGIWRKG
ncbi:Adenylate cyclase [hydrothermal vent metagenome]|uniref:Adenylate cyclase n=1 Tax=hydrothermal vent metagenome TaxID=652676 RepID=A0A3B0RCE3_9ZZZZ